MPCGKMLSGYLFIGFLLSIGYCLEPPQPPQPPKILEVGVTEIVVPGDQNETISLALTRIVDNVKVVEDSKNGMVYLISTEKKNFVDALHTCTNSGMKLLKVDTPKKNEAVKLLIKTFTSEGPFWMDAMWLPGNIWKWPHGGQIKHYYWDKGEPNNAKGNEYCIEIYHRDALWDDQSCLDKIYFICELQIGKKHHNRLQYATPKSDLVWE